jgi:hypothetical protein
LSPKPISLFFKLQNEPLLNKIGQLKKKKMAGVFSFSTIFLNLNFDYFWARAHFIA